MNIESVSSIVYGAIDELNEELPLDRQIRKDETTVILGSKRELDSLALVNLVVIIEEQFEKEKSIFLNLTADTNLLDENSNLTTLGALIKHIAEVVEHRMTP